MFRIRQVLHVLDEEGALSSDRIHRKRLAIVVFDAVGEDLLFVVDPGGYSRIQINGIDFFIDLLLCGWTHVVDTVQKKSHGGKDIGGDLQEFASPP